MHRSLLTRHLCFLVFVLASLVVLRAPLTRLLNFASTYDYGSHIVLIAPASACLIYLNRREVFADVRTDLLTAASLFWAGAMAWSVAHRYSSRYSDYLSLDIAAIVLLWISGFILCYGREAFRGARFPLLFLVLMIPIPDFLRNAVTYLLQAGSATVACALFRVVHVPVFKDGFVLLLPSLSIEVAEQCSGIRSSLALLITTLLVGEFVLRSNWKKLVLVLSVLPIVILKNALRIVTISLLTIHVDRGFLHGWLHTSGGVVFYLLGLVALIPIVMVLRRGESKSVVTAAHNQSSALHESMNW